MLAWVLFAQVVIGQNVTPGDITPALDKRPRDEYDIVPAPPPILADAQERAGPRLVSKQGQDRAKPS